MNDQADQKPDAKLLILKWLRQAAEPRQLAPWEGPRPMVPVSELNAADARLLLEMLEEVRAPSKAELEQAHAQVKNLKRELEQARLRELSLRNTLRNIAKLAAEDRR